MRVASVRNRPLLVLLSLFLCSSFLSARGQDQDRAAKRQQVPLRVTSDSPYHKWLDEDVRYIITDQERADYIKLTTAKQWDDFVVAFWERRNPTPGSTENPFKEEHYRRFAYTNEHFASGVGGWKTDRGRFYIMYGPPDSVDSKARDDLVVSLRNQRALFRFSRRRGFR